ncbi:MAG: ATP synthase F1 subunit delta [Candidatus Sumerlaeia bacterium]|nr:ATP synthase F1 subunit delta [Candidatus Sumerlaeia bacterium]
MRVDPEISRTYGAALLGAAKQAGILDRIGDEGLVLIEALRSNQKLQVFLETPSIPDEEKKSLVERVFRGKVDNLLVNFALLMLERRRLEHFVPALEEFERLLLAEKGLHEAEITTTQALDAATQAALVATMERHLGWKLSARFKVDPKVVGGVLFRSGDVLVDTTLMTQLHELERRLLHTQVL